MIVMKLNVSPTLKVGFLVKNVAENSSWGHTYETTDDVKGQSVFEIDGWLYTLLEKDISGTPKTFITNKFKLIYENLVFKIQMNDTFKVSIKLIDKKLF